MNEQEWMERAEACVARYGLRTDSDEVQDAAANSMPRNGNMIEIVFTQETLDAFCSGLEAIVNGL